MVSDNFILDKGKYKETRPDTHEIVVSDKEYVETKGLRIIPSSLCNNDSLFPYNLSRNDTDFHGPV